MHATKTRAPSPATPSPAKHYPAHLSQGSSGLQYVKLPPANHLHAEIGELLQDLQEPLLLLGFLLLPLLPQLQEEQVHQLPIAQGNGLIQSIPARYVLGAHRGPSLQQGLHNLALSPDDGQVQGLSEPRGEERMR